MHRHSTGKSGDDGYGFGAPGGDDSGTQDYSFLEFNTQGSDYEFDGTASQSTQTSGTWNPSSDVGSSPEPSQRSQATSLADLTATTAELHFEENFDDEEALAQSAPHACKWVTGDGEIFCRFLLFLLEFCQFFFVRNIVWGVLFLAFDVFVCLCVCECVLLCS